MSRFNLGAAALLLAGAAAACGDRGGFQPRQTVAPRYGDFVIPIDSFSAPERARSGDSIEVRLYPRAPYTACSQWVLITSYGWGAGFTLYGVFGPARADSLGCDAPVSRLSLFAPDKEQLQPLVVYQPDSSKLTRHVVVEPAPLTISSDTLGPTRVDSAPPRVVEKRGHARERRRASRARRDSTLTRVAPSPK